MNICEKFCNYHCAFDCPNFACDVFEEKFNLPCEEIGLERISCKSCYLNQCLSCDDCYNQNTEHCKGGETK